VKLPRPTYSELRLETPHKVVILLLATILTAAILLQLPGVRFASSDLALFFRPASRAWLSGNNPYDVHGFVNPPWTLPLMLPFSLGPPRLGYVLLFLSSCAVLAGTVRAFRGDLWALLGVLISAPTVSLLVLGQIDTWVLVGVLLGRWSVRQNHGIGLGVALALVLVKPQVGGLVALVWILTQPISLTGRALITLIAIWFASCLAAGVWWPFDPDLTWYGVNLGKSMSTRDLAQGLGLPTIFYPLIVSGLFALWGWETHRRGSSDYVLGVSLLVTTLSTPYVLRHTFSVPLATAFVLVVRHLPGWAILCYALTWTPILTLFMDRWRGWWEVGAWWVLLTGLILAGWRLSERRKI